MKIEVIISTDRMAHLISQQNTDQHRYNSFSSIHQFITRLSAVLQSNFLGNDILVKQGYDSMQHVVITDSTNADTKLRVEQIISVTENNPGAWLFEDRSGEIDRLEKEARDKHQFALGMTDGKPPLFQFDSLTRKSEKTAWALYRNEDCGGFIMAHLEDGLIDGWESISEIDLREFCMNAMLVMGE